MEIINLLASLLSQLLSIKIIWGTTILFWLVIFFGMSLVGVLLHGIYRDKH